MAKIIAISGSPSHPSRSYALIEEAQKLIQASDISLEILSIRDLPPDALIYAKFDNPDIVQAAAKVEEADAVIISAPVYKAAYPGILKTFLDLLPQKGLVGKPVLPIVTGGTLAHLLAIDYAFKPLFSALGARYIHTGVYLVDSQYQRRDTNGVEFLDKELETRFQTALNEFVQLVQEESKPSLTAV
ncbi:MULTISPECIES: NADPH-dependent FMN reductase [unclassified Leptolyngbya]|uniref:NADPH-dependent FMN reductase n=1 Tax=unclassified Leptolyngbya TaxID=2650499 RepID=UPI001682D1F7|nr:MULTISPECIES: NADPH-dependent FMN reductase [unclassified Leptolyngbya]MBD1909923.1 NADPH-dependent FMN reductase [Leptolyngbya sp. FACHB-8]MBD2158613.1 NADPH-dependent FMN reductase [Leptolyngbya sp. FACHB-16]